MKNESRKVLTALKRHGLLLISDPNIPSVVSLVTGEKVKGSWWGHPKGNLIYNLLQEIEDSPDLISVKFFNKKLTLIERIHWNALYRMAIERDDWQLKKLTKEHLDLLSLIDRKKKLSAEDEIFKIGPSEVGKLASKLEERLLIFSESVHTDSGKHVRMLYTWPQVIKEKKHVVEKLSLDEAAQYFEEIAGQIEKESGFCPKLPWN